IPGLAPGEYTVAEVPQEGWQQTFPTIAAATFRFEDLPAQESYEVGDTFTTIGTLGGIATVTAAEFFFSDGTPFPDGSAFVGSGTSAGGTGQGLFLGNINLNFTFNTPVNG